MLSKHRLEALSDGVFAIAMTLLILDIKVPLNVGPGELGAALRHDAHEWISFVVTFTITAVFWSLQHRVFDALEKIGTGSLVLTFVVLGFVSVLPFSTSLWGHHINDPLAFRFYFGNQCLLAAALTAKLEVGRRLGHIRLGVETDALRLRLWMLSGIMGAAVLSTFFVPLIYVAFVPIVLGLMARVIRARQARKWKALGAS